jgi:hypothetical protein
MKVRTNGEMNDLPLKDLTDEAEVSRNLIVRMMEREEELANTRVEMELIKQKGTEVN